MSKQKIVNEGGIIGKGESLVNQNSEEFKALQKLIQARSGKLSKSELMANQLLALKFRMEVYLEKDRPEEVVQAGEFLEKFVDILKIKKKDFAAYIDYRESNLSAIFKGKRKINTDLALKFGEIFNVDPAIWLHVQSKNELLEILESDKKRYEKYRLEDLLNGVN